jgi:hypothetical protein
MMRFPWFIAVVVSIHTAYSGAFKFNSIEEYLLSFEDSEVADNNANISSSTIAPKVSPPVFKTSPLLSMFPGSPPYVAHNTSHVGEPLILTPLIENGDIDKARNLSKLDPQFSDIASYTGFFTVNKKYNSNLFFWYVPAQVMYNDICSFSINLNLLKFFD